MQFQHFIWDFDGTLYNSYPHMTRAFQCALKDYHIEESMDEILYQLKLSVSASVRHYREKYNLDENLFERYRHYESNHDKSLIRPYAHVDEVCKRICEQGGYNYIYTHRGRSAMKYIDAFGLGSYFRDAITREDAFARKPEPDAILHLIEKYNMDKDKVLMIGDRDIDVLSGYNAGVEGCLFDPDSFYPGFDAKYRVHSMQEFEATFLV